MTTQLTPRGASRATPRNSQWLAAVLVLAAAYLSVATSCLSDFTGTSIEHPFTFAAGERTRSFLLRASGDRWIGEVTLTPSEDLAIRLDSADYNLEIIDQASVLDEPSVFDRPHPGGLRFSCSSQCSSVRFSVERDTDTEALETSIRVSAAILGECNGTPPEFVELRLQEE